MDLTIETVVDHEVVVYTDGSCLQQSHQFLRRVGYSVIYGVERHHKRTISKALPGFEQTAQRAEVRAALAALAGETRALHTKTDSSYAANGLQNLKDGGTLPPDGEHLDLGRQIQHRLMLSSSIKVTKIKGHTS